MDRRGKAGGLGLGAKTNDSGKRTEGGTMSGLDVLCVLCFAFGYILGLVQR